MDLLARTCGCGRDASPAHRTCARCRAVSLAARLVPGLDLSALEEGAARDVERSLLDAMAALDRAKARAAVALGHATVERAVPGEADAVRRTFRTPADDAPVADVFGCIPTLEVHRG